LNENLRDQFNPGMKKKGHQKEADIEKFLTEMKATICWVAKKHLEKSDMSTKNTVDILRDIEK